MLDSVHADKQAKGEDDMWNVIVNGTRVDTILAFDRNDALVYSSRKYGNAATVERAA